MKGLEETGGGGAKLEDLLAWRRAMELAVQVCKQLVPALPRHEQAALADQLRRAAQSVPANIAEGFGRHHYQDALRCCYIARGSLVEVYSHLTFAHKMEYIPAEVHQSYLEQLKETHRILNGYIAYLKRSRQAASPPSRQTREAPSDYSPLDLYIDPFSE